MPSLASSALSHFLVAVVALAPSVEGAAGLKVDLADASHRGRIEELNINRSFPGAEFTAPGSGRASEQPYPSMLSGDAGHSVGGVFLPYSGIGKGVSVDLTFNDVQWTTSLGRHVATWWNGETGPATKVNVHFSYLDAPNAVGVSYTGYNVYDAAVELNNWPRGQDVGCDLEAVDSIGSARRTCLDMLSNGRVVIASQNIFFRSRDDGTRVNDVMVFYQGSEFSCTYDPRSHLNTTWLDTTAVLSTAVGSKVDGWYAGPPRMCTQWDGTNTVVHLAVNERTYGAPFSGDHYVDEVDCFTFSYFRKVGDQASAGTWSEPQILDTVSHNWVCLSAAPHPHTGVAFTYSNPSYYGALLNEYWDRDVWVRESFDRGLTWEDSYSVTNYECAVPGGSNDFRAWLENGCFFDSEGDLHVYWGAKPTSADPYMDDYAWLSYDNNLYHWEKNDGQVVPGTGDIVKVANGTFMNPDMLSGYMYPDDMCGAGGAYSQFLCRAQMGECDSKLYLLWSQIHERANRMPWRDSEQSPVPGVLDDCAHTGDYWSRANYELLMSVARLESSNLWDEPRNITDTYTPGCGLPGDPEASGPCGSETKHSIEPFAFDESGLDLAWPLDIIVDKSSGGDYDGGWYLNVTYLDDQYPGEYFHWGSNPPTENSIKWIRLACVEPVEASRISVWPTAIEWPEWVELNQLEYFTATVVNDGNVVLNVTEIGYNDDGGGWLSVSENPTPGSPLQVTAGVANQASFDILVDAAGLGATQWLDGEVWLKSDAANYDSISIHIHLLAAAEVEPAIWDTVTSHAGMFDPYLVPEGECVALGLGNNGELGWSPGSSGGINLDYVESGTECGTRGRDGIYLASATPFAIIAADADGADAVLTQVHLDADQADETGFDPTGDKGSITGGLSAGGDYDSAYTGRFVNRDTSIAVERTLFAPRSSDPANDVLNFMVLHTKIYSGDGLAHDHVSFGNVADWDVPAEQVPDNTSGISEAGFVYVQGTDTTGVLSCQSHTGRYAAEVFGGGYTSAEWQLDQCTNDQTFHSMTALSQSLLNDTSHQRDGTPLIPSQPDPLVWWTEISSPGVNAEAGEQDQAVWLTYKHDFHLGSSDTLHYWTVLSTVRDGTLADLESQIAHGLRWYLVTVRNCDLGCCEGRVGDANGVGGDEPTIGDVSVMIDAKFITGACQVEGTPLIACLAEADVNQSGGSEPTCDDITIGDISTLIDYLFITGSGLGLADCL